jgi:tripartite-type tricarboxylate transporter receptor subunit TctC
MSASRLARAFVAAAACSIVSAVAAQDYPSKPITIIVPFPPGGVTDPVARMVAQKMSESVKQSVVVENKPGASGILASEAVKRTPPDGYNSRKRAVSVSMLANTL